MAVAVVEEGAEIQLAVAEAAVLQFSPLMLVALSYYVVVVEKEHKVALVQGLQKAQFGHLLLAGLELTDSVAAEEAVALVRTVNLVQVHLAVATVPVA
jgi:hypothetical protein